MRRTQGLSKRSCPPCNAMPKARGRSGFFLVALGAPCQLRISALHLACRAFKWALLQSPRLLRENVSGSTESRWHRNPLPVPIVAPSRHWRSWRDIGRERRWPREARVVNAQLREHTNCRFSSAKTNVRGHDGAQLTLYISSPFLTCQGESSAQGFGVENPWSIACAIPSGCHQCCR